MNKVRLASWLRATRWPDLLEFALLADGPDSRLRSFGRSLGLCVQQDANFLSFVTEEKPFPFSDWPS